MDKVDAIVVGAGVVGLAIGRALALGGKETLILDREAAFGTATSSRNSEVIHAGLYYPAESLKAELCVAGRDRLYAFCAKRGVPHHRIGKLIVALEPGQEAGLDSIEAAADAAGAGDLHRLSRAEARAYEPDMVAHEALFSPMTGIIDSHALMLALLGEAEANEARFVGNAAVERISWHSGSWQVHLAGEADAIVGAPLLVNAAGLGAQALAAATEGLPKLSIPPLYLARGNYFTYAGRTPFKHLIYPLPEPGGLGTHLTLDLAGQARFGPDVEWLKAIDYRVDPGRRARIAAAARRIWPGCDPERLEPGYSGIRPKLSGPGEAAADFVLSGPSDHRCEGLVNLFGIESPGLTASLAIADRVVGMLR